MQLGIVGLPFSGKSTLFQALTRTHLDSAAIAKKEAHIAIVRVPDERLDRCSAIFSPKSTVHATIEFVDVPGLKKAASGTTQFTTGFLSAVKTNDALIQAVRLFANDAVPHPDGSIDPLRDVATFETEFILADMAVLESRIEKINKQIARAPLSTISVNLLTNSFELPPSNRSVIKIKSVLPGLCTNPWQ